jgi:ABC-type nickel/cobalt efflux system permease component RcnA
MRLVRSKRLWAALLALAAAFVAVPFLVGSPQASAHPLGNFTINRYSRIELSANEVHVRYVLDMAEIPAFQERDAIDANNDDEFSQAEITAYASKQSGRLRDGLSFEVNGAGIDLQPVSANVSFPPGQGGLDTLRIEADYASSLPEGWHSAVQKVGFHDSNYADRIGWREIVVQAGEGIRVIESTAPSTDISNELRAYPADGLSNPLAIDNVTFSFRPGAGVPSGTITSQPVSDTSIATQNNPDSTLASYAGLIAKDRLTASVMLLALLAAVGFGAIHALSPGHGKTIVAAYLVGSRGTWRHALLLALTVTVTHTSSVYALGFVTLYLSQYILPEQLYPWLSIASGGLIVAMGLSLLVARLRSSGLIREAWQWLRARLALRQEPRLAIASAIAGPAHDDIDDLHTHSIAMHPHDAAMPSHGIAPAHSHVVPGQDGEPVSVRRLIGLGIFGGLLPCPSAIVVMLSAIALHRVAFGLLLIVAFSLGLAGVLTTIGFALVYAGPLSRRLPFVRAVAERASAAPGFVAFAIRAFPAGSATAVLVAGLAVLARGLAQQGIL